MKSIIIIGGDKRQTELKNLLSTQGFRCKHINSCDTNENSSRIKKDDILVLPVPISKDKENIYSSDGKFILKLNEILSRLDETNLIFGGGFSAAVKAYLEEKNIPYFDYLDCEEFVFYNAYLTGLSALKLLYENTSEDIRNKKVLVTGFGRVARYTAIALKKTECDVYIAARNRLQLAEARCMGYKTIDLKFVTSFIYIFDYIFNTVPDNIFSSEDAKHMKGMYFELASAPFGVKTEYFEGKENNYVFGGSLPGKYLYSSAANVLSDITVKHIISRNGGD